MKIDVVTSLFDLQEKAKTNNHYRQLAVITALYLNGVTYHTRIGKNPSDDDYASALKTFEDKFKSYSSCRSVCDYLNIMRAYVTEIKSPREVKKKTPVEVVEFDNTDKYIKFWKEKMNNTYTNLGL